MNYLYKWGASALLALSASCVLQAQTVGIGTNTPDNSAKLHIVDNNRGILIPQVSLTNVNAAAPVTAPATGLLVWNNNAATTGGGGTGFYYWNGTQWTQLSTSSGTDDQNLTGATLSGNNLTVTIENGNPATVDLSSLVNDADAVIGNEYNTAFALSGRNLQLTDGGGTRTVDLTSLVNDADAVIGNEYNTGFALSGRNLQLTDGGGTRTVDLTSLVNDADAVIGNEYNTAFALSGRNLTITDGGGARTVDLTSLVNDADAVIGNEYNTNFALSGTNLTITDGGGGMTVNLAGLNESGRNGLRNVGNFIHLGGDLIEATTITQNAFPLRINLNGTGDFDIQDNGVNKFAVVDDGRILMGDDVYWRDGNTLGTNLATLVDDDDDGRFRIYENGNTSVDLDANTQFIFNEQGLNRDFRIESDINANAFRLDASADRIGMGTGAPAEDLHVYRGDGDVARVYATGAAQGSGMFFAGQSPTYGGGFVYDGDNAPALVGGTDRITFFRRNNNADADVLSYAYNSSVVRVSSLAGGGNRMVIANGNGDLFTQAIPANGDITGVNAGNGLVGGGTAGTVTLHANANNGLYVNGGADRIRLGGNLLETTVITQNAHPMRFNLNGTGDFDIQDNGVNKFSVIDNGTSLFGGDVLFRDESTVGTNLVTIQDDGNDGLFRIYENGGTSVDLDANTHFVFNEQGLNRDFRVESDGRTNALWVDASTNIVNFGSNAASATSNGATIAGSTVQYVADFDLGSTVWDGTTIGIGSIEFLLDGVATTLINNAFGPTTHLADDLGVNNRAWDDVYADNYVNISDEREKENITDLNYGLKEVLKLRPVSYTLKKDQFGDAKLGLIAQEALQVIPEVVKTHDNRILNEDTKEYERIELERMGMTYQQLIPVLIKATQEQQEQIEALKAEIKELKAAKK